MANDLVLEALMASADPEKLRRVAAKHGVDLDTAQAKYEQRNKAFEEKRMQEWISKKNRTYRRHSLYSGGQVINFSFNKWNPDIQPDANKAKEVASKCHKLADSMLTKDQLVVLSGKPGTGKTSLALAMLNYVSHRGKTVMMVSTIELLRLIRNRYEQPSLKERIANTVRGMKEVDVLLLDDFGTEGGMKDDIRPVHKDMQEEMFSVINARFDEEENAPIGSIIITTNNTSDQLSQMYNEKLLSRLIPKKNEQIVNFNKLKDVRGM